MGSFVPEGHVRVIRVTFRASDLPQPLRAGDIVVSDSDPNGGYWVALQDCIPDQVPAPGESNESLHYALSQSILSRTLSWKQG
jgi:hypothetical protein